MNKQRGNQNQNGNHSAEFEIAERKSSILADSKSLLRATRRQRQRTRNALFTCVPVLLIVIVSILAFQFREIPETDRVSLIPLESEMTEEPRLVFEVISDQELLATLSELGQPSVLATIGGELKLVRQNYNN